LRRRGSRRRRRLHESTAPDRFRLVRDRLLVLAAAGSVAAAVLTGVPVGLAAAAVED
jgi:hypothetical protein